MAQGPIMTNRIRQMEIVAFGGPENLRLTDAPMPVPGPGQLRVRVLAASVQFTDVLIRKGIYPDLSSKPPLTPGYDVVGEVHAVGDGVDPAWIGRRVADLTMIGSYATHRLLDADRVTEVPQHVDPAEATALVLSWMTAYQLLHRHAAMASGQRALVHGAAGAVGQALSCLAQRHGVKTFGTARAEHADLVASYGATPIDYRNEDFRQVLKDGVDVVFDGIAEDGYRKSWSVVRKGGFLSAYGMSQAVKDGAGLLQAARWYLRPFIWNILPNGKRAGFYSITATRKRHPDWFSEDLSCLLSLLAEAQITPRIEARIRLSEVPDAHRQLESGGLTGKLVITPE